MLLQARARQPRGGTAQGAEVRPDKSYRRGLKCHAPGWEQPGKAAQLQLTTSATGTLPTREREKGDNHHAEQCTQQLFGATRNAKAQARFPRRRYQLWDSMDGQAYSLL